MPLNRIIVDNELKNKEYKNESLDLGASKWVQE
jgi:hypothetical protein